jgi:hypothetical protein
VRLQLVLAGPYRSEIGLALSTLQTWFTTVDHASDVLHATVWSPLEATVLQPLFHLLSSRSGLSRRRYHIEVLTAHNVRITKPHGQPGPNLVRFPIRRCLLATHEPINVLCGVNGEKRCTICKARVDSDLAINSRVKRNVGSLALLDISLQWSRLSFESFATRQCCWLVALVLPSLVVFGYASYLCVSNVDVVREWHSRYRCDATSHFNGPTLAVL